MRTAQVGDFSGQSQQVRFDVFRAKFPNRRFKDDEPAEEVIFLQLECV